MCGMVRVGAAAYKAAFAHSNNPNTGTPTMNILGTSGADTLYGTSGDDYIDGFEGDDALFGGGGNDFLVGGAGDDFLEGGGGNDNIDYVHATGGVSVNLQTHSATGAGGNDTLWNIESMAGSSYDDVLVGDAGGNWILGRGGNDLIDGGDGFDTANYQDAAAGVTVDLVTGQVTGGAGNDQLFNIEGVYGSGYADLLVGDDGPNMLYGRGGNDTLRGGAGEDSLNGGEGDDFLDGGEGRFDQIRYDDASGAVQVNLQLGTASGAAGNDTFVNIENVAGSNFDDVIIGNAGDSTLQGLGGNDFLDGGAGSDAIDYYESTGGVYVNMATGTSSGASGNDTFVNFEGIGGSFFDDVLIGDANNNYIHAQAGNDRLDGGAGDDYLSGGAGDDFLDGGTGNYGDVAAYEDSQAGVSVDLTQGLAFDGWGGTDTLRNIEHVNGSMFGDNLVGDANGNWFRPASGNDFVDGRAGLDVVMYETATGGVTVDLQGGFAFGADIGNDQLVSIEAVHGSLHDDHIQLSNTTGGYVFGRAGNDVLRGGSNSDNLIGGLGNDTLDGGAGNDTASYFDDAFEAPGGHGVVVDLQAGTATDNWGFTDTLVNIESVSGSEFADRMTGSVRNDTLIGNGGDDVMLGGAGSDFFIGGAGNDIIDGGAITDLINYNDLNTVSYQTSSTGIVANLQTGRVEDGLGGVDTLSNINWFNGSAFADRITGSSANWFEQFDGGAGDDFIDGGAIDPITFANANRLTLFNSGSAATVDFTAGTAVSGLGHDTLANINHVVATRFADTLLGSDSQVPESFAGRGGNDFIDGKGGLDEVRYNFGNGPVNVNLATGVAIDGEGGIDTLAHIEGVRGSNGNDTLTGGNAASDALEFFMGMAGNDTIDGGSGYDRVDYQSSTTGVRVTLGGTSAGTAADGFGGTDTLINIEAVRGSNFNDVLTGSDSGAFESFEGREGNDVIDGKGGVDRADYASSTAGVSVNLAAGTAADGFGGTDTLVGIENVRGSSFADVITGDTNDNVLQGGAGNDQISGGAGDDILAGGAGDDRLTGGDGYDQFAFEASGNGLDRVADFGWGDTLLVAATLSGRASAGNGSALQAGQMQAQQDAGGTTLYIGTDAAAGADIAIHFDTAIDPSLFAVIETADGHSLVGLVDAPKPGRVAEIAVQFQATIKAHADVAGKVAGKSTTNEVAVAHVSDLLERFSFDAHDAGGDTGGSFADAGGATELELLGVASGLHPLDAGAPA